MEFDNDDWKHNSSSALSMEEEEEPDHPNNIFALLALDWLDNNAQRILESLVSKKQRYPVKPKLKKEERIVIKEEKNVEKK